MKQRKGKRDGRKREEERKAKKVDQRKKGELLEGDPCSFVVVAVVVAGIERD